MNDVRIRPLTEADWQQVHDLVVEVAMAGETYAMDGPGVRAGDARALDGSAQRGRGRW